MTLHVMIIVTKTDVSMRWLIQSECGHNDLIQSWATPCSLLTTRCDGVTFVLVCLQRKKEYLQAKSDNYKLPSSVSYFNLSERGWSDSHSTNLVCQKSRTKLTAAFELVHLVCPGMIAYCSSCITRTSYTTEPIQSQPGANDAMLIYMQTVSLHSMTF